MEVHAEYRHSSEGEGIFTVCGEQGPSHPDDINQVTCSRCLDIIKVRLPGYLEGRKKNAL